MGLISLMRLLRMGHESDHPYREIRFRDSLLASCSLAAILFGASTPSAFAACYTGSFPYSNGGTAYSCITVDNTSFTGDLSNRGTLSGAATAIGIINGSTITGSVKDSGTISASNYGILIDSTSKITSAATGISIKGPTFKGGISNAGTISAVAGINVNEVASFGSSGAGGGIRV